MTGQFNWDNANNPIGQSIDQVLYRVRSNDKEGLIFDSLTLAEIIDDSEGPIAVFDALVTPYSRLDRKVNQLRLVMDKAVDGISTVSVQVSEPFKQNGSVHVAAVFELTDGQTASVIFHNPDSTPNKLGPSDEMISWKWMLNKKDITIVVAPENGRDLAIREVGRRIMKLAFKNSAAFARINQKRAERLENIKNLTGEVEQLEQTLTGLEQQITKAKAAKDKVESIQPFTIDSSTELTNFTSSTNGTSVKVRAEKEYKFLFKIGQVEGLDNIIKNKFKRGRTATIEDAAAYGAHVSFYSNQDGNIDDVSNIITVKLKARGSYKDGLNIDFDYMDEELQPYFANLKAAIEKDKAEFLEKAAELIPNLGPNASQNMIAAQNANLVLADSGFVGQGDAVVSEIMKLETDLGGTPVTVSLTWVENYSEYTLYSNYGPHGEILETGELTDTDDGTVLGKRLAAKVKLFLEDPTKPQNYKGLLANPRQAGMYSAQLNDFFVKRMNNVSYHLTNSMGWDQVSYLQLSKKGMTLSFDRRIAPGHMADGAVIALTYSLSNNFNYTDDLTKTELQIAEMLDGQLADVSIANDIAKQLIAYRDYKRTETGVTKTIAYYGDELPIDIKLEEERFVISTADVQISQGYTRGSVNEIAKYVSDKADNAVSGYMPSRMKALLNVMETKYGAQADFNVDEYDAKDEVPVHTSRGNSFLVALYENGDFKLYGLDGIRDLDPEGSAEDLAARIDALDFANSTDTDETTGLIEDGEYQGKTPLFAYAAELLKKAAKAVDLNIAFGEFNATTVTKGLFDDSSFEDSYNVVAQIAKGDTLLGRASVNEYGNIRLLEGANGDQSTGDLSSLDQIVAVFKEWVGNMPKPEPKYPDDFDPTKPANYDLLKRNADLDLFQDRLDAFFQERFIAIRNELRALGWSGEHYKELSKNGYTLVPEFEQVGGGGNLVGLAFRMKDSETGQDAGFFMSSALGLSAAEYADRLDMGIPKKAQDPVVNPEPIVVNGSDPLDISMANKQNAIQLAENLKTFSQQPWVMRTTLNDVKDLSVDQFRELYQADLEALKSEHDQVIAAFNTLFRAAKVKDRDVIQEIANETNSIYKLLTPKGRQLESEWQKLGGEYTAYQKSLNTDPIVDPDPDTGDDETMQFLKQVIANPGNYTDDESLDKLTAMAESLGDDETSELAQTIHTAALAVQEVAFKQLQDMVNQG